MVFVEDVLAPVHLERFENQYCGVEYGLHEFTQAVHDGRIRMRQLETVLLLLGRADMQKGRHITGVIERLIQAVRTYRGHHTLIILGGPFPGAM